MYFCWLHPHPCHFLSVLCWHWVPWAGFCGQEPFSLSSVGEALPSLSSLPYSPLLERGWLGKREKGTGSWCTCLVQRKLPPSLIPLYPSLPTLAQDSPVLPGFVCASRQGRRWSQMGGGLGRGDGDSWADSRPLGRRAG